MVDVITRKLPGGTITMLGTGQNIHVLNRGKCWYSIQKETQGMKICGKQYIFHICFLLKLRGKKEKI